jgi:excisionase family DNA binding protein
MNEQGKNPFEPFFDEIRRIVREEITAALGDSKQAAIVKEWLSAKECAALYGLPPTWFEEKGRAGQIARTKPGRYVLFKRRDVEEYLERNKKSS